MDLYFYTYIIFKKNNYYLNLYNIILNKKIHFILVFLIKKYYCKSQIN